MRLLTASTIDVTCFKLIQTCLCSVVVETPFLQLCSLLAACLIDNRGNIKVGKGLSGHLIQPPAHPHHAHCPRPSVPHPHGSQTPPGTVTAPPPCAARATASRRCAHIEADAQEPGKHKLSKSSVYSERGQLPAEENEGKVNSSSYFKSFVGTQAPFPKHLQSGCSLQTRY